MCDKNIIKLNHDKDQTGLWYEEENTRNHYMKLRLKEIIYEGETEFQKCEIIKTEEFGKTLILDGKTQSAEYDEAFYHETLVHPAMIAHSCPKTVFIGGGGELATAREVLKHNSVEKVIMVDLDGKVVELCKEWMPEWGNGVCDDSRLEIVIDDAFSYLNSYEGKFDVIIMDIVELFDDGGPGYYLYTDEFYSMVVNKKLNEGGVFVTQSCNCSTSTCENYFTSIHHTLKQVFKYVSPCNVLIPSFADEWGFNVAFNKVDEMFIDLDKVDPDIIDRRINERITKIDELKFYDGISHRRIFSLPKKIRKSIQKEKRVLKVK